MAIIFSLTACNTNYQVRNENHDFSDFIYPVEWVQSPRHVDNVDYLIKKKGSSYLFCLNQGSDVQVYKVNYDHVRINFNWSKVFKKEYEFIELGPYEVVKSLDNDKVVMILLDDVVYRVELMYQGKDSRLVNKLFLTQNWELTQK